jgi:hypothetical protein
MFHPQGIAAIWLPEGIYSLGHPLNPTQRKAVSGWSVFHENVTTIPSDQWFQKRLGKDEIFPEDRYLKLSPFSKVEETMLPRGSSPLAEMILSMKSGTEGSAQESRYGYSRCSKDDLRINGERGGK